MKQVLAGKQILSIVEITDGQINKYLYYLLNELRKWGNEIRLLCGGVYNEAIRCLKDSEFEQSAVISIPFSDIQNFNQIWIMKDNFYGPLWDLDVILQNMAEGDYDYWEAVSGKNNWRGKDSHCFTVLNEKAVRYQSVKSIWDAEAEDLLADRIIEGLKASGLKRGAYIELESADIDGNDGCKQILPFWLLKKYKCPILPRNWITDRHILASSPDSPNMIMDYINGCTKYKADLIWDDLIKKLNIYDIKRIFHLNYILSGDIFEGDREELKKHKTAVVIHLHYIDLLDELFEYIKEIPEFADVYLTASTPAVIQSLIGKIENSGHSNIRLIIKENRGRDLSGLLVACGSFITKYEFLCFVHDKKNSGNRTVAEARYWLYELWENSIGSSEFFCNVLKCFLDNKRLGLFTMPEPFQGNMINNFRDSWGENFRLTRQLAEQFGLECNIDRSQPPLSLGTVFWCRTAALKKILYYKWKYEDFPEEPMPEDGTISHALERVLPYAAQHEGYYTAVLMKDSYAALRIENLQGLLRSAVELISSRIGLEKEIRQRLWEYAGGYNKLIEFCRSSRYVYIYGAGTYGKKCLRYLKSMETDVNGFAVSYSKGEEDSIEGKKVYYLEEIKQNPSECGIIVAVKDKIKQQEIINNLAQRGFEKYILFWEQP